MGNASTDLALVFGGVFLVLVFASALSAFLRFRYSPDGRNVVLENLDARIMSWWAIVGLLAFAFIWGKTGVIVLFGLCSFAALREFVTLTSTNRADHWALAASFFVVLPLQYILVWHEWYGLYSIFIPVYAFLFIPIFSVLRGDTRQYLVRIAETQWGLMICVFCASHVPALLSLEIPGFEGRNVLLIAFLVIVVQSSDVFQYVWGKLLGKHKLAPALSPSKTVEGAIGGLLSASLLGASLFWICLLYTSPSPRDS